MLEVRRREGRGDKREMEGGEVSGKWEEEKRRDGRGEKREAETETDNKNGC